MSSAGSPSGSPSGARSLADDIRARTDDQLAQLVLLRPDLARPAPADLTSLAARAATRASVQRCIETLDRGHLQVLEAVVVAEDPSRALSVEGLMGGTDVAAYLRRLWDLALVWRSGDGLYAVRTVPEVLGPHPAGLGPSALELGARSLGSAEVRALVADAPASARGVLDRLEWGPPVGVVNPDAPGSDGVRWLLEHGLLHMVAPTVTERARTESETRVLLPREVALVLRDGRLHQHLALLPPDPDVTELGADRVDAAAGGEVSDLLSLADEVVRQWGPAPPRVLRTGGLAVRGLRRLAEALDVDATRAAWLVEVMLSAGLVADDGDVVPVWAPTRDADDWLAEPAGSRWVRLAAGWLTSTRAAHLVGARTPGSSGPANALGPDVHWPPIRALRADVVAELGVVPAGQVETRESLLARLAWRRPLRNPTRTADTVTAVLREAAWLGLTGRGALSTAGRALTKDGPEVAAAAMAEQLPAPVKHVLLQADLTAIAPGPLHGELAQLMRLSAEVESRGGATVHRFTPGSVRRALDAGWTADELLEAIGAASRTGLPQPLQYLIRDIARQHGQTRVGRATAYVRSDDESLLESLVVERSLGALQLRRIAPTVLVSPVEPQTLVELMREAGFSPVSERADGSVVVSVADRRRALLRRPVSPPRVSTLDPAYAISLVRGLRAAEESARRAEAEQVGPSVVPSDPEVTLAALRDAVAERHGVWIGYVDTIGHTDRHLFYPTRVEGGRAFGRVADSNVERGFAVSRITGVADLPG